MDFDRTLESLAHVPDHEFFRLSVAVNRLLADPRRILAIRQRLHLGLEVGFIDPRTGQVQAGRVAVLGRDSITLEQSSPRRHWKLPYPAVLTDRDALPENPPSPSVELPREVFALGDMASFCDRYGVNHVGRVIRRNPKTVTLQCDEATWRVAHRLLRRVIDI
jgi:hypothetical protein